MVGVGDVGFVLVFRHYGDDVDRFDLHRARLKRNVGSLAVGFPDHGLLFSLHGEMDPPLGRDDRSRMDEDAFRSGKGR